MLARFKREAQAAGRLNHPGIVAVYDYGEAVAVDDKSRPDGDTSESVAGQRVAFIAMEFVEGRELKEHFDANECFSLVEVARIMGEILDALDHSHGKGVTHRDIKPSNLIMLTNGRVKIADFGIARTETSELTQAGAVLGTPAYMSPEQFQGMRVDLRSDIFACGVVLYQFLTGEKPFTGHPTTIMYKVLREEPVIASTLNASLSGVWDEVLAKALGKHPDDRYQSAREFAAGIREALAIQMPGFAQSQSISAALGVDDDFSVSGPQPASALPAPELPVVVSGKNDLQVIDVGKSSEPRRAGLVWGALGGVALLAVAGAYFRPVATQHERAAPLPEQATKPLTPPPPAAVLSAPAAPALPALPEATSVAEPAIASAPASAVPAPLIASVPASAVTASAAKVPAFSKPPAASRVPPSPHAVVVAPRPPAIKPHVEQSVTRSPRCALILEKAGVDEPISTDDRAFLKSSCR